MEDLFDSLSLRLFNRKWSDDRPEEVRENYPTDGSLSNFMDLCFNCHQGEFENGTCNHCGAREIRG